MDYTRNIDKVADCGLAGVSYNQVNTENALWGGSELFTVTQFKEQYGKIDTTEEDALISSLIVSARTMCEQYVGMNFIARDVIAVINNLNGGTYLPYGPVGAIASVVDIDDNAIATDGYKIVGTQFKQILWPRSEYLKITYTGGYVTCPTNLINAVKAQALFLFENRGDSAVGMSPLACLILNPLRRL